MRFRSRLALVPILLAMACSAKVPTTAVQFEFREPVVRAQRFHVEQHSGDERDYATRIRSEIASYGFDTTIGPPGEHPPGTEVLVRFTDRFVWQWSTYLASMAVMLYDAETGALLVAGRAESMDKLPPEQIIREAVASIFRDLPRGEPGS